MPFISHQPDKWESRCKSPEHEPPNHIVLEAGRHEYQCPECGAVTTVRVNTPSC